MDAGWLCMTTSSPLHASGQLTAGLVREFLEFFELDFTCSVFDPESNVVSVCVCVSHR